MFSESQTVKKINKLCKTAQEESTPGPAPKIDWTIGHVSAYDVTLTYGDSRIPAFRRNVTATSPQHAERVASYDATANGWPREHTSAKVRPL